MTHRSTRQTVRFRRPFQLTSVGETLPAGDYEIDTEEELLAGLSFTAYRRLSTTITVRLPRSGARQVSEIDPDDLALALARDAASTAACDALAGSPACGPAT